MERKKKMRARLGFIKQWLKAAESDYAKDRKEDGEMHLLLLQAEAKRALELSLADKAEEKKSSSLYLILAVLLAVGGIGWLMFELQEPEIKKNPLPQPISQPQVRQTEKTVSTVKETVTPKATPAVKVNDEPVPLTEPQPVKQVPVSQPKEKIAVDMVDLVQEAEKNLYGKKEVMP